MPHIARQDFPARNKTKRSGDAPAPLRLLQISDCHLSADPRASYRGARPAENFISLLPHLCHWRPDLIVASGDLSQDHTHDSYHWLWRQLETIGAPVLAIPGNHDNPEAMAKLPFILPSATPLHIAGWSILGLNSRWGNRAEGLLGEHELQRVVQLPKHRPAIIFVHHHPRPVHTPWIDRFPLLDGKQLLHRLRACPQVKALAFGHIHHAWQGRSGHCRLLGAPATSINTMRGVREFTPDQAGPKARWLLLYANGNLRSGVLE